jgi:outer membrane lipoprotein SlyB
MKNLSIILGSLALVCSACETKTQTGALAGAGAGAFAGGLLGGGTGAVIGGVLVGAALYLKTEKTCSKIAHKRFIRQAPEKRGYTVTI